MSLSFGPGPFSPNRTGQFSVSELPDSLAYAEPYPRRVRALLDDRVVLDSEQGWMVHAPGKLPTLWFPAAEIDADAVPAEALRDFDAGQDPIARSLAGFRSLAPAAADRWFVEDEPVYSHIRDPYHRVDVVSSHRHVTVEHAGVVVADSTRPKMLYETGLPVRYYLPWDDVRLDLLERSDTVSECPYKGDGQHWNLVTGNQRQPDAAWSLPHPLPEGIQAAEHVSFYPESATVTVDGTPLE